MALRQTHTANQRERRTTTRRFQAALREDSRSRVRKARRGGESLVVNNQLREAWSNIHRQYQKFKGHRAPPTIKGLEHTSTLREDLYRRRPPEGGPIPILVQPVSITDRNPEGE